jgi:hypothetical protein
MNTGTVPVKMLFDKSILIRHVFFPRYGVIEPVSWLCTCAGAEEFGVWEVV